MEKQNFPLNIIKEKIILSVPQSTQIENKAVIAVSVAVREFLKEFNSNIKFEDEKEKEKKILLKDIKEVIEKNEKYSFLKLLDIAENK